MKVLHIINSLTIGGAETLLVNSLTSGGLPEKCENILVYLQGNDAIVERIDKRVKVICLNYKGISNFFGTMRKLRNIAVAYQVDIVHSHLNPAGFYSRMALPAKLKQVHTVHIMYSHDAETAYLKKALERRYLFKNKSTSLIFLSELLEKDFLDTVKFTNKHFVLNNCIGDEFFTSEKVVRKKEGFKVVAVGNLREQKNYPFLLEIFKHLKKYDISLDIYGAGKQSVIQQQITANSLSVRLMGPVSNIAEVLGQYDLFMMSSTFEGYPLSVIEAMAVGLPCLLSNIPSLKDTAKEYADYFELDNPAAAAKKILALADRREELAQKGIAAKAYALQVGKKGKYVEKLVGIYETVING